MLERRILILVSALVVFFASAALWNAFVRRPSRSADGASPAGAADSVTTTSGAPAPPSGAPATPAAPIAGVAPPVAQPGADAGGARRVPAVGRGRRTGAVHVRHGLVLRRGAVPMADPVRG